MPKKRLDDVVVFLPGITGSVLQKDGKDLWAPSAQGIKELIRTSGSNLESLAVRGDDSQVADLGDGISATRLVPDVYLIPKVKKLIDGYSSLTRFISDNFTVEGGGFESGRPGNFFEFPYDWRRDNRIIANQLEKFVNWRLRQWRDYTGNAGAKVILMAHSMGGLVSRYYLEKLEGWRDCKALITFATPYRGSVDSLNYLANGYKKMFVNLTRVMRTFTSMYQLLPIYECVRYVDPGPDAKYREAVYAAVHQMTGIPNVEPIRAKQARAFHSEIEEAVNAHRKVADYLTHGYRILPFVGTRQPTLQSAELSNNVLRASTQVPSTMDELLGDGDSTVPRLSAIPIELSDEYRETFVPEKHGAVHSHGSVLDDIRGRLEQMQVRGLHAIRGPEVSPEAAEQAAISLDVDDVFVRGEAVVMRVQLVNVHETSEPPVARIEAAGSGRGARREKFHQVDGGWHLTLEDLTPGLHRVTVDAANPAGPPPTSVHDLIEVID